VLRYVTPAGSSTGLSALCAELGGAARDALSDGRLFVDRTRETSDRNVEGEHVVEVYAPREETSDIVVLYEREGLVFVAKPPGIPTEPDRAGSAGSVVARVATALSIPPEELHALSRLDVGVSGVVTLARHPAGRALVDAARRAGRFHRRYVAIAAGAPDPADGTWSGAISRGARGRREIAPDDAETAQAATTHYQTIATATPALLDGRDPVPRSAALLALMPVTGRTHQLRAHASSAGTPLLGDPSYGGPRRVRLTSGRVLSLPRVFLHAAWVELRVGSEQLRVAAPLPADFAETWDVLGGDATALERAIDAEGDAQKSSTPDETAYLTP
jgi:23S rRNA-/tRNA-specific pseudouridylate synthase